MTRQHSTDFHLVALDTEGDWNRPLLENAAIMSGAECVYATSGHRDLGEIAKPLDEVLAGFQNVVACEAIRNGVSIYDFPVPRSKTAIIVGNEEKGIPRSVLKKADSIVSIPMAGSGMSSVNVAVSAAIALYVFSKDMGRKRRAKSQLTHRDVDLLIHAPADSHELGSLLRSAWAFGWRRVYVSDPHSVWFSQDSQAVLQSRAAARRHKNPLAVLSASKLDVSGYDAVLNCTLGRQGRPLSRLQLPDARRMLFVIGDSDDREGGLIDGDEGFYVDYDNIGVDGRFRHIGSIVLSVVSEMLAG